MVRKLALLFVLLLMVSSCKQTGRTSSGGSNPGGDSPNIVILSPNNGQNMSTNSSRSITVSGTCAQAPVKLKASPSISLVNNCEKDGTWSFQTGKLYAGRNPISITGTLAVNSLSINDAEGVVRINEDGASFDVSLLAELRVMSERQVITEEQSVKVRIGLFDADNVEVAVGPGTIARAVSWSISPEYVASISPTTGDLVYVTGLAGGIATVEATVAIADYLGNTTDEHEITVIGGDPDLEPPLAPASVTITQASAAEDINLSWNFATDNETDQDKLQYKVVAALSAAEIDTPAEADAISGWGALQGWTANIKSTNVADPTPGESELYYMAILVKDESGNKSIYWNFDWVTVGAGAFSQGVAPMVDIAINSDGDIYTLYRDSKNGDKLTCMKTTDEQNWSLVGGAGFSAGKASYLSLAVDPTDKLPVAAYINVDNSEKVTVNKFNGSSWTSMGEASVGKAAYVDLLFYNNNLYLAYLDLSDGKTSYVRVSRWDGSSWQALGGSIFTGDSAYLKLAATSTGIIHIAYQDRVNRALAVRYYDVGQGKWLDLGTPRGISDGDVAYVSTAMNSSDKVYVAYQDADNGKAVTVKAYDSSKGTWDAVGNKGFTPSDSYYINLSMVDDAPVVSYLNKDFYPNAMKFDPSDSKWKQLGSANFSAQTLSDMTMAEFDGVLYVAFNDTKYGATVKKGGNSLPFIQTVAYSNEAKINSLSILGTDGSVGDDTVLVTLPYGTDVTALVPSISISDYASIDPEDGVAQDFTDPVVYTVTAQDGVTTQVYTVTVEIEPISTVAVVTSTGYKVSAGGTASETITYVPESTTKENFLGKISKGNQYQTWDTSDIGDPVVTGDTLVVTAQDGVTVVTYTITSGSIPQVGDIGPSGGYIFWDNADYSYGWRFLEAAASDQSTSEIWSNVIVEAKATNMELGQGILNTELIVNQDGHTQSAAKVCSDLVEAGNDDWYLPDYWEMYWIWAYLYRHDPSLGGFVDTPLTYYWASNEQGGGGGGAVDFTTYFSFSSQGKNANFNRVRCIRQF